MKNFIILIPIILLIACTPSTILDKKMEYIFYEKMDYKLLLKDETVSEADVFLINYAIVRQRDYFNYTVEGKTYGEILAMAKDFQQNGMPVKFNMNENSERGNIQVSAVTEGVGFVKKDSNSKRVIKTLNFRSKFDNPTDKDIVILNSSFVINGPFGDYLTTVNYDINCIAKAKNSTDVSCIVPGKVIQKNLLFEGSPYITRLGIDEILSNLNVAPSGVSTKDEGRYFKECFFNASRIEPQVIINYQEDFEGKEWKSKGADGVFSIDVGDMHIPDDTDEVIQMR